MTSTKLILNCKKKMQAQDLGSLPCCFWIFLCLSCKSGIDYENAANSQFAMYNGYTPLVDTGTLEYLAKVLEYKTKAVVDLVSYGNVMPLFLMVTAAVVIGAAGFVYLHNQKKVIFYHSLPKKGNVVSGISCGWYPHTGSHLFYPSFSAYSGSCCIRRKPGKICRTYALWLFMNLLYYMVTYETVIVAMMMTGKIIVGLLATAVFFSFFSRQ